MMLLCVGVAIATRPHPRGLEPINAHARTHEVVYSLGIMTTMFVGRVVGTKMQKTAKVEVTRMFLHPQVLKVK